MENFWQTCSAQLELELTPQQYSAWIKPLVALDYEDGKLRIAAPNRFKLDWVKTQFATRITALACQYWEAPTEVQFVLDPRNALPKKAAVRTPVPDGPANGLGIGQRRTATTAAPARRNSTSASTPMREQSRINTDLTFDSFVTGKANQLARAAAIQVANNPGVSYNPLFFYGGVGLGKTHLIHAIGNQVMADQPDARIRYIHAEQYVRDVVTAYQRKGFDDFKHYYHSLDMLLIDDIQFFGGKSRTQEEFFYAFEALIAAKKQIIITSDTYPKEITGMDDRLISRFDSGLTVAIEPPELEMRVAILLKKAQSEGVTLLGRRGVLRGQAPALERARAGRRAAQDPGVLAFPRQGHHDRYREGSAEGSAVGAEPPDFGGEHPEDGGGLLQHQGCGHVLEAPAGEHRPPAPDCDVPGQGTDAEELAGDRRTVWRTRPHDGAARGAQDRAGPHQEPGMQPRAARAGTDPERANVFSHGNFWQNGRLASFNAADALRFPPYG